METYIAVCKIDNQRKSAVCLRKLKQGLCINLAGWEGEGDGRELQKAGDICMLLSRSSRVRLCATPQMAAHQAPPVPGILQARTLEWVAISFSTPLPYASVDSTHYHNLTSEPFCLHNSPALARVVAGSLITITCLRCQALPPSFHPQFQSPDTWPRSPGSQSNKNLAPKI